MSVLAVFLFFIATIILSVLSLFGALSEKVYFFFARLWADIFLFLFRIRVTVIDHRKNTGEGGMIYCANHCSYTDIPVLLSAVKTDLRLVLRSNLTRIPIWGWALKLSPMITIDRSNPVRSRRSLAKAIASICNGASVLLFPEGTRSADGALQPFKRGAFHIAYQSGVPVVPVAVIGTFEILPRMKKLPRTGRSVTVIIGEPISADLSITDDRSREIDLMNRTYNAVGSLAQENH